MPVPQLYRILPEVLLTLTGVLVMLIEPVLPRDINRKSIGFLALTGTVAAMVASLWQLNLPPGTAFYGTVRTDVFSAFFHVVILGVLVVAILIALDVFDGSKDRPVEYFALLLFGATGMCLMTSAVELLLVFISLEISSISTYILAAFRRRSGKSPEAGLKYFLLGSFATAFFLYGIALTFGATGTTNISEIGSALTQTSTPGFAWLAIAAILIGIGFKVSAAPFQVWTPDVYEGAPSPVVALLSTAPKVAAFAVLLRMSYAAYPQLQAHWLGVVWIMAVLSMTVGNLGALRQHNVKRMLAYSSIAHAGYTLVAFTALSQEGIAAAMFYTAAYAAMNVGVFAVFSQAGGYEDRLLSVADYRGLAYRSPLLGGVLAFLLLSLIGIPFTGGFFGKFYVFTAALHSGEVWLAVIGLVNSGVAAYYYLRLLTSVYGKPADESPVQLVPRPKTSLALALLITVLATLFLGIFPGQALSVAQAGAATFASVSAASSQANSASLGTPER
ncbi:MAG: NADH-quinone oxidoreductase subunit N [Acidobacteriaceae bacterium]